jgi:hypothetical protein
MTISVTNTETIRDAIATILETALTGAGNVLQSFYGYEADDFGGQSPVMVMATRSNAAEQRTSGELARQDIKFDLISFVLYKGTGWTPADCEDKLNEVYKDTLDTSLNNQQQTSPVPYEIFLDGEAPIVPANVGGFDYRMQTIPILVTAYETG